LEARDKSPGLSMSDLLALPEPQSSLLSWMVRQGQVELEDVTAFLKQDAESTRALLADLVDKGYVREIEMRGVKQYRVRMAPKRGRELPANLWQALDDKV
jgi:Mn-dependent DtxR family transcriptional regulator